MYSLKGEVKSTALSQPAPLPRFHDYYSKSAGIEQLVVNLSSGRYRRPVFFIAHNANTPHGWQGGGPRSPSRTKTSASLRQQHSNGNVTNMRTFISSLSPGSHVGAHTCRTSAAMFGFSGPFVLREARSSWNNRLIRVIS